jgi:two-component system cell cycle sensor histidine kinase/response regulator CckA
MPQAQVSTLPHPAGVLVVEDDDRVRRLCVRSLRTQGYHVMEAASGWEAIELVTQHAYEIDVVVTDIIMPGLNGIELVARLRAAHPKLAIVLMSGYAPMELLRRGALVDTFPLLQKPFLIDQLFGMVRQVLGHA